MKKMKTLGLYLTKVGKGLYTEIYKTWLKDTYSVHNSGELMSLWCSLFSNLSIDSMQSPLISPQILYIKCKVTIKFNGKCKKFYYNQKKKKRKLKD